MSKSFPILIGILIGTVISKLSTTPITWEGIGYVTVFFIVISHNNLNKWFFFIFGLSYLISEPMIWVYDTMKWYQPLLFLWILILLLYNYFPKKQNKPLFVNCGDITRFPVEYVTEEDIKEEEERNKRVEKNWEEWRRERNKLNFYME